MRKHSQWLWGVIIAATVVSFIFWGAKYTNGSGGSGTWGMVLGQSVSAEDKDQAEREVTLLHRLQERDWPEKVDPLEVFSRILLIRKAEAMGIHVDDQTVAKQAWVYIQNFGEQDIDQFARNVLGGHLSVEQFEQFLRHQIAIEQVFRLYGMPGELVTRADAEMMFKRMRQEISLDALFFSASNYLAQVPAVPDPARLAQYYTNNMDHYRLPERVQVNYVWFNVTNYLAQAEKDAGTNLAPMVEAKYTDLGTNWSRVGKTPEEAKARIREALIRQIAGNQAHLKANDFANAVLALQPPSADNLERVARTNGLEVHTTQPFDELNGPKELPGATYNFPKTAFALTPEDPIGGPLPGEDGFYEIAFKARFPEETNRPLSAVHDQVVEDYKYAEAVALARQAGERFAQAATNSPSKSFNDLCAQAKVTPTPIIMSLSTQTLSGLGDPAHMPLADFKEIAFSTRPGKISPFQFTADGGVLVYVKGEVPLEPSVIAAGLPEFWDRLRATREQEAFGEWFSHERANGLRDIPSLQRPAQSQQGGNLPQL